MKQSSPIGCFVTNTLILAFLLCAAFGPADGPEGPEAVGRAVAALIALPFFIAEVVMLVAFLKPRAKP